MGFSRDTVVSYLRSLTGEDDPEMHWVTLWPSGVAGRGQGVGVNSFARLSEIDYRLERYSSKGFGVYVVVNATDGMGAKADNIVGVRAAFVDIDDGRDGTDLFRTGGHPSFSVYSGRGPHHYWPLDPEEPVDGFEDLQLGLAKHFGADIKATNRNRLMRVPGFPYRRGGPGGEVIEAEVDFVVHNGGRVYTRDELVDVYGLRIECSSTGLGGGHRKSPTPETPSKNMAQAISEAKCLKPAISGQYGDDWTYVCGCFMRDYGLDESEAADVLLEHWNPRCQPPWNERDLREKVKHAWKYAKGEAGAKAGVSGAVGVGITEIGAPASDGQDEGVYGRWHTWAEAYEYWKTVEFSKGIPIPVPSLARRISDGGLPVGGVTVLVAKPKRYKSDFVRQMALHAAKNGHPVLHVDVENGPKNMVERDLAQLTGIAEAKIKHRDLTLDEFMRIGKAFDEMAEVNQRMHRLCTHGGVRFESLDLSLRAMLEEHQVEGKPALVVFDSAQRLASGYAASSDPRIQNTAFMQQCERWARELNIAVLVTSEMRRGDETSDAAATGGAETRAIEFVASLLLFVKPVGREPEEEDELDKSIFDSFKKRFELWVLPSRNAMDGLCDELLVYEFPHRGFSLEPREANCSQVRTVKVRVMEVLDVIIKASAGELRERTGSSKATMRRALIELEMERLIEKEGKGRGVKWKTTKYQNSPRDVKSSTYDNAESIHPLGSINLNESVQNRSKDDEPWTEKDNIVI